MTPEEPTLTQQNSPLEKSGQDFEIEIAKNIRETFASGTLEEKLDVIPQISKITEPSRLSQFENLASDLIKSILPTYTNFGTEYYNSQDTVQHIIKAIKLIEYLPSEKIKHELLRYATETYEIFRIVLKRTPNHGNIEFVKYFFNEIDGKLPSDPPKEIFRIPRPLSAEVFGVEYRVPYGLRERIELVFKLLRLDSWTEIAKAIKIFYFINDDNKRKIASPIIKSIEQKIFDLIKKGLKYTDENPPDEGNSLFSNLMALDSIEYAPDNFKAELIKIAEANIDKMGDNAKKKLESLRATF